MRASRQRRRARKFVVVRDTIDLGVEVAAFPAAQFGEPVQSVDGRKLVFGSGISLGQSAASDGYLVTFELAATGSADRGFVGAPKKIEDARARYIFGGNFAAQFLELPCCVAPDDGFAIIDISGVG